MSSKRGVRRRECQRKRHYETYAAAHSAMKRTGSKDVFGENREGLAVYACPRGDGWVVGHVPGTKYLTSTRRKAEARGRMRPKKGAQG